MLTWWWSLWQVAKGEFRGLARRPQEWLTGIVFPVAWLLLASTLFGSGLMRELPVGVVNLDQGPEATRAVQVFDAIPSMALQSYPNTLAAEDALKTGAIYATVVIPEHYSEYTADGIGEPIIISINKSYFAIGTILEVDLKTALAELKRERAAVALTKLREGTLKNTAENMRIEEPDVLFDGNVAFNFSRYLLATLVPGLMGLALAITLAGVLVRDWRDGGMVETMRLARGSGSAAVLGKTLPWVLIYSVIGLAWVAGFGGVLGWIPMGSLWLWIAATVLFILATASVVIFLTSLSLTWILALTATVAIFAPTFPFTAFSYPFESMTPGATFFGKLLPLTHYLQIQGQCMVLNSPIDYVLESVGVLGLFVVIPLAAGLPILGFRMMKWAREEEKRVPPEPIPAPKSTLGFFETARQTIARVSLSRDTLVVALLAVAFYLVFYAWPYSNQQLEHIPTMVVDLDQSATSRHFTQALSASPTIELTGILHDEATALDAYRREKTSVLVTIPRDFEKDLAQGHNTTVHLLSNGAYPVKGRAVQSALTGLILDSGRKLDDSSVYSSGMPPILLEEQSRLSQADNLVLYRFNEIGGYGNYSVPAVAPVILQAVMLMLITFSVGEWLKERRASPWFYGALRYPFRRGPAILLGFWFMATLWLYYMQGFDFWFNEYGNMENALGVLGAGTLFAADIAAFSFLIALLLGSNRYSTQTIVMFSAPAVFISGAIWPQENVTASVTHLFAHLLPSTPGVKAIVALSQDGATLPAVSPFLLEMAIQTLAYTVLALLWLRARGREKENV